MKRSQFTFNCLLFFTLTITAASSAAAQHIHTSTQAGEMGMSDADARAMTAHMEMTPLRPVTAADSLRASAIVTELRMAIDKYRSVKRAEADGFKMFAPQIKNQRVYHFTKGLWAIENQFRFNPAKPTRAVSTTSIESSVTICASESLPVKTFMPIGSSADFTS